MELTGNFGESKKGGIAHRDPGALVDHPRGDVGSEHVVGDRAEPVEEVAQDADEDEFHNEITHSERNGWARR